MAGLFKPGVTCADQSRMTPRKPTLLLWSTVALLVAGLLLMLTGPMVRAWRCYLVHQDGHRAQAELVKKLEPGVLALQIQTGPKTGDSCIAKGPVSLSESAELGERLDIVYLDDRPGDCVLESTLEFSGLILWSLSAVCFFALMLIFSMAAFIQRSLSMPGWPDRRMDVDAGAVLCPACGGKMNEGYLPLVSGIHWRDLGQPIGLPNQLSGLPGTVGWKGRPLKHAFHCAPCEIVTFQYGKASPSPTGR
jgi:type II secretory pathway component PulM